MAAKGSPAVEVEGARELRRALRRMGERADDLTDTHRAAAERVETAAEHGAPKRSGRLAGSGKARATKTRAYVTFGTRLEYAAVIHFGWPAHNIAPDPFLYDALDDRRSEVVELYERRIEALIHRFDLEAP